MLVMKVLRGSCNVLSIEVRGRKMLLGIPDLVTMLPVDPRRILTMIPRVKVMNADAVLATDVIYLPAPGLMSRDLSREDALTIGASTTTVMTTGETRRTRTDARLRSGAGTAGAPSTPTIEAVAVAGDAVISSSAMRMSGLIRSRDQARLRTAARLPTASHLRIQRGLKRVEKVVSEKNIQLVLLFNLPLSLHGEIYPVAYSEGWYEVMDSMLTHLLLFKN